MTECYKYISDHRPQKYNFPSNLEVALSSNTKNIDQNLT